MIQPPSIWYAQQDLSRHFMRDTSRPFEEGVSRGQLRAVAEAERLQCLFDRCDPYQAYAVIADNRMAKGRIYGMRLGDLFHIMRQDKCLSFNTYSPNGLSAAAFCVFVSRSACYISGWAHVDGVMDVSPMPFLCKGIYLWCQQNGFTTMDIGIGGEQSLDDFKRRLGFKRACDA